MITSISNNSDANLYKQILNETGRRRIDDPLGGSPWIWPTVERNNAQRDTWVHGEHLSMGYVTQSEEGHVDRHQLHPNDPGYLPDAIVTQKADRGFYFQTAPLYVPSESNEIQSNYDFRNEVYNIAFDGTRLNVPQNEGSKRRELLHNFNNIKDQMNRLIKAGDVDDANALFSRFSNEVLIQDPQLYNSLIRPINEKGGYVPSIPITPDRELQVVGNEEEKKEDLERTMQIRADEEMARRMKEAEEVLSSRAGINADEQGRLIRYKLTELGTHSKQFQEVYNQAMSILIDFYDDEKLDQDMIEIAREFLFYVINNADDSDLEKDVNRYYESIEEVYKILSGREEVDVDIKEIDIGDLEDAKDELEGKKKEEGEAEMEGKEIEPPEPGPKVEYDYGSFLDTLRTFRDAKKLDSEERRRILGIDQDIYDRDKDLFNKYALQVATTYAQFIGIFDQKEEVGEDPRIRATEQSKAFLKWFQAMHDKPLPKLPTEADKRKLLKANRLNALFRPEKGTARSNSLKFFVEIVNKISDPLPPGEKAEFINLILHHLYTQRESILVNNTFGGTTAQKAKKFDNMLLMKNGIVNNVKKGEPFTEKDFDSYIKLFSFRPVLEGTPKKSSRRARSKTRRKLKSDAPEFKPSGQ